jgi:hypothetical protein
VEGSRAEFTWIITPSASSSSNSNSNTENDYLISSSANPFALNFNDTSLRRSATGSSEEEALTFTVSMQKTVFPNADVAGDGAAVRCVYDEVVLEGTLFLKRQSTFPDPPSTTASAPSSSGSAGAEAEFKPWPYAVEVAQTAGGPPACYRVVDGRLGERVEIPGVGSGGECECRYRNFGT